MNAEEMNAQALIREARELADQWYMRGYTSLNKAAKMVSELSDALEAAIEDFEAYVASGVPNPAPYCANACKDCVDGRVWCKEDRSTCKGFAVRTGGAG